MPESGSDHLCGVLKKLGLITSRIEALAGILDEQPLECRSRFLAILEADSDFRQARDGEGLADMVCDLEAKAAAAVIRALPVMHAAAGVKWAKIWIEFILAFDRDKQASSAWRSAFWLGAIKNPVTLRLCLLLNQELMKQKAPSLRVLGAVLRMAGQGTKPNPALGLALKAAGQDPEAALTWVLNHVSGPSADLDGKDLAHWLRHGMALSKERRNVFFQADCDEAARRADAISKGLTLRLWQKWLEAYASAHAGHRIRLSFNRDEDDLTPYLDPEQPERINLPRRLGPGITPPRSIARAMVYAFAMGSCLGLNALTTLEVHNLLKQQGVNPPSLQELSPLALFTSSFASPRAAREILALILELKTKALIPKSMPGLSRDFAHLWQARTENPPDAGLLPPDLRIVCAAFQMTCGISLPKGVPPVEMVTARRIANEITQARDCRTPLSILELCAGICILLPPESASYGISRPSDSEGVGTLTFQNGGDLATAGQGYGPHFEAQGRKSYGKAMRQPQDPLESLAGASSGQVREAGGYAYPEWDAVQGRLIENRAWVVERPPLEKNPAKLLQALAPKRGLAEKMRRAFQALAQPRPKDMGNRLSGVRLDLDSLIREQIERHAGFAPPGRIYQQPSPRRGELCCGILWDVSGSTRRSTSVSGSGAEVINTSRNALALFCRALSDSGDSFAVWAFSGVGPDRVDFFRLKEFDSLWAEQNLRFLAAIKPMTQNRDGAAIRHAAKLMKSRRSRHKIMMIITDGRPDDYAYPPSISGKDITLALSDARKEGIKTLALLLPSNGRRPHQCYLDAPHVTLPSISGLARLLPVIYHRLTA